MALIEEGVLNILYETHDHQTLDNRSVAIFNPREIHCTHPMDAEGYYILFLNHQWCQEIQKGFFFQDTILHHPEYYRALKEIFHQIFDTPQSETLESTLKAYLKEIFSAHAGTHENVERAMVVQIKEYITTHDETSLNIEQIAKYVGYDKSYLIRVFKKEVGMTPQQYILNEKVNRAKDLLSHSTLRNLSDISLHAGFFDQSHLNRNFKGLFGTSPKRYKKVNIIQDK